MSDHEHGEAIDWLLENWIARLADSLEGMTGERPGGVWRAVEGVPSGAGDVLWWEQPLSLGESATFWAGAPQAAWLEIGSQVLRGAGIEVSDPHDARNTYLEVLSQACSGLARAIGSRVGAEVACEKGHKNPPPAKGVTVFDIDMMLGGAPLPALHLCLLPAVQDVLQTGVARPGPNAIAAKSEGAPEPLAESADAPRTLDLLLEVELPVSVSFGRARLPLRDVLKLTSGSIVELNRTVSEPVEVIVNGCVIARGEVVVVEGNYGVRIQEIISREKRLRTLP
jgi:flagellar motor switch protein FliN/FliY